MVGEGKNDNDRSSPVPTVASLTLLLGAIWAEGPALSTSERLLDFARSKIGQRVGDGECSSLVVAALDHAKVSRRGGQGGWGDPIDSLTDVRPGDILHFEDARFAGRRLNPNRTITRWSYHFPDHVAIVAEVGERRGTPWFRIIHQNARIAGRDTSDTVKEWTLDMATFQGGSIRPYRVAATSSTPAGEPTDNGNAGEP